MAANNLAEHALIAQAPAIGSAVVITTDASAQTYDLGTLGLGGLPTGAQDGTLPGDVYLTLYAETASVTVAFGASTGLGPVTVAGGAIAVGGTAALSATAGVQIAAGSSLRVRYNRTAHRYLYLLGSGAGTLRIVPSSPAVR